MKLSLFNYNLPPSLIAHKPASPRDHSRLFVFDQKTKQVEHKHFFDLPKYLNKNHVLVFNNSKVFPARLIGKKQSGGKIELLLLQDKGNGEWEAMIKTKRPKIGLKMMFSKGLHATLTQSMSEKTWLVKFNFKGPKFYTILDKIGLVPTPPYIKSQLSNSKLKQKYQTVYASQTGSAAAPTAGLHFTKKLLNKLTKQDVQMEQITLHVGLGTFNPVTTNKIEDYNIHKEWVSADKQTINRLVQAKKAGKRIVAVGTTSVRTLETIFAKFNASTIREFRVQTRDAVPIAEPSRILDFVGTISRDYHAFTDIYIYPGYKFKFVDSLITNFHLPKSSLLILISALIGRTTTLKLYKQAIKLKYRFFSFGDAMFLK
jgi:S-adenosylmethionine:tRNA ribosyltransferase-isomerase